MSAPPPGIYVPAVLFFDDEEELDSVKIKAHVLRLAQVRPMRLWLESLDHF